MDIITDTERMELAYPKLSSLVCGWYEGFFYHENDLVCEYILQILNVLGYKLHSLHLDLRALRRKWNFLGKEKNQLSKFQTSIPYNVTELCIYGETGDIREFSDRCSFVVTKINLYPNIFVKLSKLCVVITGKVHPGIRFSKFCSKIQFLFLTLLRSQSQLKYFSIRICGSSRIHPVCLHSFSVTYVERFFFYIMIFRVFVATNPIPFPIAYDYE